MSNGFFISTSNRIRSTPFSSKNELAGVKNYTVYNNTLLPTIFKSLKDDYYHLIENVQLWDVCCQKVIEVKGRKSLSLMQYLFCRDFSKIVSGKSYYAPIVNFEGGLLNDPVVFCIDVDHFLISISDSDLFNWISAINHSKEFYAEVNETDILTIAIQGPKSEKLMSSIFGEKIKKLKFFHFSFFEFEGTKQIIARSGYSKQDGFEIYLKGFSLGKKLWETIWEAGKDFNISPGCPNLIDRIEGGLLSYGNEFTLENNPIECGFDNYCNNLSHDFIGKNALKKILKNGIEKKIKGITFDGSPTPPCTIPFPVYSKNRFQIGNITSGIYSPFLKTNIGLSMVDRDYWNDGQDVIVLTPDNIERKGKVCSLPFNYS